TAGPYTARAGNLLHLRTNIIGSLGPSRGAEHQRSESSNLKQIVKALHPTPAVCGLPREAAKKFILENENYDREFYTGFLGELNLKTEIKRNNNRRNQENQAYASILNQTSLYVNLRCLKLDGGIANIYVGGGITKDSKPSQEWEETENKSQTMKSVLVK
ncbi:MAG: chorismate-binding protein, partial [Salegentibacter sp.]